VTTDVQHRILIVEDNRDAAKMMGMMLALRGNEVELAFDGVSALQIAERFSPSVVLCDIGLPGEMTGYAVAEEFRRHQQLSSTFLVAVTGYGRAEDRQRSHDAGFDAHLTKPVSLHDLRQLLQNQAVRAG
jgi:CheY-like chemotaxis protein